MQKELKENLQPDKQKSKNVMHKKTKVHKENDKDEKLFLEGDDYFKTN